MYLGTLTDRNVVRPIYDIEYWSCYDRVLFSYPRTTNSLESWHKTLKCRSEKAHPNLARFVEILQNVENDALYDFIQLKDGNMSSVLLISI